MYQMRLKKLQDDDHLFWDNWLKVIQEKYSEEFVKDFF